MKDNPDAIDVLIGSRIRVRREQLNITQTKLGEALRVSFQQVQKYETGKNRVAASRICELSKVLEVPNSYFFTGMTDINNENTQTADAVDFIVSQDRSARRLLRAFNRIKDEDTKNNIISIVDKVASAFEALVKSK